MVTILTAQTISFPQPADHFLSDSPVTLSATASSGLTATFSSNSSGVCSVSGTRAILVATGTCSITAHQAGNSTYAAAPPLTTTFMVNALPAPTITSPASGFSQTSTSVTVVGTAQGNTSITIFDGATQVGTGSATPGGTFSIGITLAIGSHSLTAKETVNSVTNAVTGTIAPPAPTITSPINGFRVAGNSIVTVAGTSLPNALIAIFDGGSQAGTGSATPGGTFGVPVTLGGGGHSLTATQTVNGVTSAASTTVSGATCQLPNITSLTANPNVLWPPNQKLVSVQLTPVLASGACSPVSFQIINVTSNEPVDSNGDWVITGNTTLQLRADRLGAGNGRVYTITLQAKDSVGQTSTAVTTVSVPHNQ
jgi:hypothetical protein